jgi:hypothetical protein
MASKLPTAKMIDLVTTVDTEVVHSATGPMVWGSVEIYYASDGLEPKVTIKIPIPAFDTQSDEQRRTETLRRARKLIDHACLTMEPQTEPQSVGEFIEGLAEELGVVPPTTSSQHTF